MAEIILPPEENEETPQVPELNIDKPTENSKVITIEFEAKKTNKVSTKDTNQQLYTTDTDAWFEFKETSLEGANGTYSVVFRNRHDGSIFQRTGDVVGGVAYYKIPHQEIRHAGAWRGQIVYTLSNGDTTSREFGYDVKGHILDGKDVREIVVEDFETLMSQLRNMKDNAELELANLVNTTNQNEAVRQVFFDDLVDDIDELQANYQELLDTGVLQTNINTKLEALEEEYAPKLTEVTAQLAQTNRLSISVNYFREEGDEDDTPAFKRAMLSSGHSNIEIPEGEYILSEKITIPYGKRLAGKDFRDRTVIRPAIGYEGTLIELGDGCLLENIKINGNDKKGTGVSIEAGSKWARLKNVWVSNFETGIKIRTYYHHLTGLIVYGNDIGIEIGFEGSYAGGTTIDASHIRDNRIGVKVLTDVNSFYLNGCIFEWNDTHIEADGEVDVRGAYLEDMPKTILSSTKEDVSVAYIEQGAGKMLSGGSIDEICYAVKHPNAHLVNGIYGVQAQFSSHGWKKGAVFGEGFYTFTNVKFHVEDANIKSGLPFETSDKQMISRNSTNYPNYIKNGLFLDASSIVTDYPGSSMVSGQLNPWGGKVVRFGSSLQSFTFDVPPEQVGKRHLLYIFLGKNEGVVSTTYLSLSRLENIEFVENGINQTFGYTDDNPRTIGGEEDRLGFSVFEVIPTNNTGKVVHFGNILPDSNGFMDIAGVILTPIDETEKNYPIGWFNNG